MGKDVIVDRYARLYEIPWQLANVGHEVEAFCLSYYRAADGEWIHGTKSGALRWHSRSLGRLVLPALLGYLPLLLRRLRRFKPDLIVGASDIPHVVLGAALASCLGVPFAADLYDNFEGFGQARLPGAKSALRWAVRRAAVVTTTSDALASFVRETYGARGEIIAMPSTIDSTVFKPFDGTKSREQLGLPTGVRLVGTAGGLHGDKGIGTLYAAWRQLAAQQPDVHLVLAGPTDTDCPPPNDPRVHYLGMLPHARIAELFSALDVGVIYLRDTTFGRYCFPQKAYEMVACKLPVVAGNVGATAGVFADVPQALYRPDDAADLASRLAAQLANPQRPDIYIADWTELIAGLEPRLVAAVERHRATAVTR